MRYSKELLKGNTPVLVMSVLKYKDLYGYEIIRKLEFRGENPFEMNEGALYPVLHALEKEKFLTSYWEEKDGIKCKYYHITEKGEKQLAKFLSLSNDVVKFLNFADFAR